MLTLLFSSLLIVSCKKDIDFKNKVDSTMPANELNTVTALTSSKMYFVSPSGNDSSNGISSSTAWRTIAKVNATTFAPGDLVLFEGGKTFNGKLYIRSSGSSGRGRT